MKPTNYHLFDFLDFDESLSKGESLWKAYSPRHIEEHDGDIIISVPFQRQVNDADMAADSDTPLEHHCLVLRQYGDNILRLFMGFGEYDISDRSEMLQMSETLERRRLHAEMRDDQWLISTDDGTLRAVINLQQPPLDRWSTLQPDPQETFDLRLYPDGRHEIRLAAYDHFSPPRYDALPVAFCRTGDTLDRAAIAFECRPDECFAGTGERFTKMDLSGHTFYLKNQDGQGVNNSRCYKNIPFYVSSRMYGAFFHTCARCKLDLADHSTRSVQFMAEQSLLDTFLIGGDSMEEIIRGYRDLTGYPQMPPLWSFGVWMSRMTYFSADEVSDICRRLRREHYPCDVIHLDTGWFKTDWLCEWKFNEERFPEPEHFIRRLREHGFKVSLWQLPYVAEGAEQIDEAMEHGYLGRVKKKQKTDSSNFSALDYAGTIDFTNPEATEWYKGLLRRLLRMGVACIKTDFGENIHMDAEYYGMKPELLNNLYALLYQKAAYEVTREVTGEGIIWARAAWAGCQRYPLHWGGDSCSSWDGMAGSLKGGLHFGLSGFAFWSHDIPGFHTLPNFMNSIVDSTLYVRWTQFGVFTSHMRYHGTNKREPWHYPDVAPIVRRWWQLRYKLIPYILYAGARACESGASIIQALIFHHPHDPLCWHIDDEYYFGDDILVCPVMNAEGRRNVYLPDGRWADFFTGEQHTGGQWLLDVDVPLDRMPVYLRVGAVIPLYPDTVDSTDDMNLSRTVNITIDDNFRGITV